MKLTIPLRDLRERVKEIPLDRDDCYLISILVGKKEVGSVKNEDGSYDEEGVYPVPFVAREFDPVCSAIDDEDEEWDHQYGGKGGCVRLGRNTPGVSPSVKFVFQWDEGHPNDTISHIVKGRYCIWCGRESRGHVSDCLGLRSQALADAVLAGDTVTAKKHAEYIKTNHRPEAWLLT